VRFGCSTPFGEVDDVAEFVATFATEVEARGLDSIWLGEHTHLPLDSKHRYVEDGRVPDRYKRFLDPWTVLTAVASHTTKIRVGTLVALVAEHNPLALAKQIATVDVISRGRVDVGMGYGWNPLEMINNGVDPKRKRGTFREKVRAMKLLWTEEHSAFSGEFVNFSDSWSLPHPMQRPHPPLLLGAAPTPGSFTDIVELCDGWIPVRVTVDEGLEEHVARLRRQWTDASRDPARLQVTVSHPETSFGKITFEKFCARLPTPERLERYRGLGITGIVCSIPNGDRGLMLKALDRYAELHAAGGADHT
jgi:probable F420-dependent oxidoreductase